MELALLRKLDSISIHDFKYRECPATDIEIDEFLQTVDIQSIRSFILDNKESFPKNETLHRVNRVHKKGVRL